MREEAVVRLADPLRDFSQPSVEPCVAYVSDPLPMARPDDLVLLSFETSVDRSDNPLGVVEPVGGFYALVKGGHCLSPRHCDVHGTIHAIRRHLLQAVNQGVRKIVLIKLSLDEKQIRGGARGSTSDTHRPTSDLRPVVTTTACRQRQTRRSTHDEGCNLHGNSWNKLHKNHGSEHAIFCVSILPMRTRYGEPQDLYRTVRRFVKLSR